MDGLENSDFRESKVTFTPKYAADNYRELVENAKNPIDRLKIDLFPVGRTILELMMHENNI